MKKCSMMKIRCVSVRLKDLRRISPKAFIAEAFDGSSAVIPASQVFGPDFGVEKSDAWWISEWILRQKRIQWTPKKVAWFDSESGKQLPTYMVEHHRPEHIDPVENNEIDSLRTSD